MSTIERDYPCCDQPGCDRLQPILLWHDGDDWFFVTEWIETQALGIRTPIIKHRVPLAASVVLDTAFNIDTWEDEL